MYEKYLSEPKYEFLIKRPKKVRADYFNDRNEIIERSNKMDGVYQNIDD